MKKSTVILIVLATLVLGALIGGTFGWNAPLVETPQPKAEPIVSDASLTFRYIAPDDIEVGFDESGRPLAVAEGENFISREKKIKSETVVIQIEAEGRTEYKALMQQGDTIVYTWQTDGPAVYYDFHAHDDAFGEDFYTRYSEGEASTDSGSIVAAYNGEHGWYLRNREDKPVQVTLQVTGFFDKIVKIDL